VTLKTADSIPVPGDTWVDWDAKAGKFITAAEKFPNGTTAKIKSVVTYPADLFTTVKWHDGSPISVADFIMPTIQFFDEASKDSKIYDPALEPYVQSVLTYYKGFRITSTNPLTIENYSDQYYADAELDVTSNWPTSPTGLTGENSWDVLAVSNMAAAAGELAYTADQADAKKIEQMSWVGGPSLDILSKHLGEADSQSLIPYPTVLGQYITAADAKTRYDNLTKWYADHATFWIGTGPYYLDKVFTTEKTLVLKNNPDFPDLADRWASFSTPMLATAALDGPAQVKVGDTPTFDINVTYKDAPYKNADIKQVKYLLYDATGAVVSSGDATAMEDGHYQVALGADVTSKLVAGSDKIEVAVVPIPVAIPAYASLDFVVVP
jgi:peptide/nickel transport system substrate-binding protein